MKLSTFIKSYKIALTSVCDKVSDWKAMFIGSITFPDETDNRITFIYSNSCDMEPGSMGISASLSIPSIESISGGLDSFSHLSKHISQDTKINDSGRFLIILSNLSNRLKDLFGDDWVNVKVSHVWFNPDRGFAYFELDRFKTTVQTDGFLFLFGDPLDE